MKGKLSLKLALSVIALASASSAFSGTPGFGLAPVFTDHAVLQRDKPVAIWGHAAPGAHVDLHLNAGDHTVASVSGLADAAGAFSLSLPQTPAGGPYTLSFTDSGGHQQTLSDILIGDVWLCSGQSNMEFALKAASSGANAVASAADPDLRIFNVTRRSEAAPVLDFTAPTQWRVSSPESAADTSAVCYFMAQKLRDTLHVPQGIIHASWGGTDARVWISRKGLSGIPEMADTLKIQDEYVQNPSAAMAQWDQTFQAWWRDHDPDYASLKIWNQNGFKDDAWPVVTPQGVWESSGIPELRNFDGVVWYRQSVTLTKDQAAEASAIELGPIDDDDTTWINGVMVGATNAWDKRRHYTLPKGALHAGSNVIAIRVLDTGGGGGMYGKPGDRKLILADGTTINLPSEWRYHIGADLATLGTPPALPWAEAAGPATLYNGMIAPLVPYTLKGVAWYQGEANAGDPALYARLLSALVADWRTRFKSADLPFLVVQLSAFGMPHISPQASGWAGIRDVQRRLEANDPHVGMALSYDVGDPYDIHPTEKRVVGQRLALAAQKVAYGQAVDLGPRPQSVTRQGQNLVVDFTGVDGGLVAYGSNTVIGFEVCADTCQFVDGHIDGNKVVLTGAATPAAKSVRFGWADVPTLNLFDKANLPASPFAMDIQP